MASIDESGRRYRSWRSFILGNTGVHVTSDYHSGHRGTAGRGGWHTGTDFGAKYATPVRLPLSGKVVSVGFNGAFGRNILVKLDNGDYMMFAHLSKSAVQKGQRLKVGAYIGNVGATGNVTGAHLHVEIRRASSHGSWRRTDSTFYDPVTYLDKHASHVIYGSGSSGGGGGGGGGSNDETPSSTTNPGSGGGGGGGGAGKVAFSKKDFYADLEAMFGDLDVLLAMDAAARKRHGGKSIKWAIDEAVKQKITDPDRFLTLLNKTAWFKMYGQETTRRLVEEKAKPKIFATQRAQIQASIAQQAANIGVKLDPSILQQLARDAYVFQWDTTSATVLDRIQKAANAGQGTFAGGQIGESIEEMDQFARAYGVGMSEADLRQLRNDIFDGLGDQRMRDLLQKRSAERYVVFAEDIKKGVNLRSLMDPYLQSAAQLLERSADEFDMDDPLFAAGTAFQKSDPATGKIVQRSLDEFERMIRSDKRWGTTANARETAMKSASSILQQMGLM